MCSYERHRKQESIRQVYQSMFNCLMYCVADWLDCHGSWEHCQANMLSAWTLSASIDRSIIKLNEIDWIWQLTSQWSVTLGHCMQCHWGQFTHDITGVPSMAGGWGRLTPHLTLVLTPWRPVPPLSGKSWVPPIKPISKFFARFARISLILYDNSYK